MAGKIWTAEELEALSLDEQDALFEASIIRDLDQAPQELVERVRARVEARIAAENLRAS